MTDRIYLLSDLHLNLISKQKRQALLKFFSETVAANASTILLNGDIVDLMDDKIDDSAREDIQVFFKIIHDLAEQGIPVHYLLGNHDLPLLLLFPDFAFQDSYFVDVHAEYKPLMVTKNFTLHYRSHTFSIANKKVYIEHGHIYDLGWVPGVYWQNAWMKASQINFANDFVEQLYQLWNAFHGCGEDYEARIIRTGAHLPAPLYASREATRISIQNGFDWVLLGHFHSPIIEELGNGKVYANSGDSLQHGNYLTLSEEGVRLSDWRE